MRSAHEVVATRASPPPPGRRGAAQARPGRRGVRAGRAQVPRRATTRAGRRALLAVPVVGRAGETESDGQAARLGRQPLVAGPAARVGQPPLHCRRVRWRRSGPAMERGPPGPAVKARVAGTRGRRVGLAHRRCASVRVSLRGVPNESRPDVAQVAVPRPAATRLVDRCSAATTHARAHSSTGSRNAGQDQRPQALVRELERLDRDFRAAGPKVWSGPAHREGIDEVPGPVRDAGSV